MPVFDHRKAFAEFHSSAPRRLIKAVQAAGSERKFSKARGVNILYVSQLLRKGIEPTDKTEKGRQMRVKLFLPARKKHPPKPRKPLTPMQQKIEEMRQKTREALRWKRK